MKINIIFYVPITLCFLFFSSCGNNEPTEEHKDNNNIEPVMIHWDYLQGLNNQYVMGYYTSAIKYRNKNILDRMGGFNPCGKMTEPFLYSALGGLFGNRFYYGFN